MCGQGLTLKVIMCSLPDILMDTPLLSSRVTLTLPLLALKSVTVNVVVCLFPRYS